MSRATGCSELPGVWWNSLTSKYHFICGNCSKTFVDKTNWQKHKLRCYLNSLRQYYRLRQGYPAKRSGSYSTGNDNTNTKPALSTRSTEVKVEPGSGSGPELNIINMHLLGSLASTKSGSGSAGSGGLKSEKLKLKLEDTKAVTGQRQNPFANYRIPKISGREKEKSNKKMESVSVSHSQPQSQVASLEEKINQQIEQAVLSITEKDDNDHSYAPNSPICEIISELNDLKTKSAGVEKMGVEKDQKIPTDSEMELEVDDERSHSQDIHEDQDQNPEESVEFILLETDEADFVELFGDDDTVVVQFVEFQDENGSVVEFVPNGSQEDVPGIEGQGVAENPDYGCQESDDQNIPPVADPELSCQMSMVVEEEIELGAVETVDVTCDIRKCDDVKVESEDIKIFTKEKTQQKEVKVSSSRPPKEIKRDPDPPTSKGKVSLPSNPLFHQSVLDKTLLICLRRCDDPPFVPKRKPAVEVEKETRLTKLQQKIEEQNLKHERNLSKRKSRSEKLERREKRKRRKASRTQEWGVDVVAPSEEAQSETIQSPIKLKIKRRRLEDEDERERLESIKGTEQRAKCANLDEMLFQLYDKPSAKTTSSDSQNSPPMEKAKVDHQASKQFSGIESANANDVVGSGDQEPEPEPEPLQREMTSPSPSSTAMVTVKALKLLSDQDSGCGSSISSEGENYQEKCDSLQNDLCQSQNGQNSPNTNTCDESRKLDPHPIDATGVRVAVAMTSSSISSVKNVTIISYLPSKAPTPRSTCRTKASELAKKKRRKFFDGYCKICGAECEFQTSKTYYINPDPRIPFTCFTCHESFSKAHWEQHDKICLIDEEMEIGRAKPGEQRSNDVYQYQQSKSGVPIYGVMKKRDFSCVNCFNMMSRIV